MNANPASFYSHVPLADGLQGLILSLQGDRSESGRGNLANTTA
ncbi:hypothetical protein [Pseudoduganella sp. HUAS MS19]